MVAEVDEPDSPILGDPGLAAERDRLARTLRETRLQLAMTQSRLAALEQSVTMELGRTLVRAARRPWPRGVQLPLDLVRLWRERGGRRVGAAGRVPWRRHPALYREHALFITVSADQAREQLACAARVIMLTGQRVMGVVMPGVTADAAGMNGAGTDRAGAGSPRAGGPGLDRPGTGGAWSVPALREKVVAPNRVFS
jgi:hypothetical protein